MSFATIVVVGTFSLLFFQYFIKGFIFTNKKGSYAKLPPVPVVPGLPVVGNLLQMKEKKPYKTFTNWAETYGPIYSIRTGASTVVVLNTADVALEAMVTRHSSISSKKLTTPIKSLSFDDSVIASSNYNDFHKMGRRHMAQSILGPNAQKRHQNHRYTLRENVSSQLHAHVKKSPNEAVNFKKVFEPELFGLSLKQALGKNVEGSIYVEELGTTLSRNEIFEILVADVLKGATETDWRDFFPYLRWIPNKNLEMKIQNICFRRKAVMSVLIEEQMKRIASGQEVNCFLDYLLCEGKTLTTEQITVSVWESILEAADTTVVTMEWAMYELAKHPKRQERLHEEIQNACGCDKVSEEHLSQLPYLNAVFHETLRKHSPVPVALTKYVDEDTQLGGYYIPAGTQIAVNLYGCNMDKNKWDMPEEWKPERFLEKEKWDPMELQKTMAFGGGKRACAGSLQAMLIVCTTIGRLVQEFEWRLREGDEEEDTAIFTNHKLHAMHAVIKPRN
ncbi:ent-kaurene oxidase-like isoform X1 [Malus sylvestris]|uniref:ent-kaurene oxidase-like isoform X1 n=1 Tax=Malus sylvestris TaxID=3752 RepID=UPI0021AC12A6|nr:ent-kaurene oxidase-like isoform X1 [Malus sylvestris]